MTRDGEIYPDQIPAETSGGCASTVLCAVMWLWSGGVVVARLLALMLASLSPSPASDRSAIWIALVQLALVGLPALALSRSAASAAYRPYFRSLAASSAYILFTLPVLFVPASDAQLHAVLHALLSIAFTAVILYLSRRATPGIPPRAGRHGRTAIGLALLAGALLSVPWLRWGSLGSPLDTVLEMLAAFSLGIAAAATLQGLLFQPWLAGPLRSRRQVFAANLAAGSVLFVMASGTAFPYGGMQLLLALVLSSLGGLAVGLFVLNPSRQPSWRATLSPLALLLGLASAAPLALIDPDELPLILSITPSGAIGDILRWALSAAGVGWLVGMLLSSLALLIYIFAKPATQGGITITAPTGGWRNSSSLPLVTALLALVAWSVAMAIYFLIGQPGFYGERLFVILKSQPDLSLAEGMQDYQARRASVYQTLVGNATNTQANLRQTFDSLHLAYTPYYLENAIEVQADPLFRLWLAGRPEVDRVLNSPHLRPLPAIPPVETGASPAPDSIPWNLRMIGADRVWNELGVTGQGVVVGQSDSGVWASHPDLAGAYRGVSENGDYNWFDPMYHTTVPTDLGGHGTHTLGIVLGKHTGVAPGATWYACANLVRNLGNPALYLDCMQFMLAPFPLGGDPFQDGDPSRGAMVINNSWGCPDIEGCDPDALIFAARALRSAGVFVEASAGNDGPGCSTIRDPLSLYDAAFTTGAIDSSGQLAFFSSLGPVITGSTKTVKPDIVAPGVDILSTFPRNTYASLPGTSMAGPHAVGVVALMWSANPKLIGNIDRTEQILAQSAQPYTGQLPNCPGAQDKPSTAVGYGVLDAYQAVLLAQQEK